jgi:hypothetical protein
MQKEADEFIRFATQALWDEWNSRIGFAAAFASSAPPVESYEMNKATDHFIPQADGSITQVRMIGNTVVNVWDDVPAGLGVVLARLKEAREACRAVDPETHGERPEDCTVCGKIAVAEALLRAELVESDESYEASEALLDAKARRS